MTAYALDTNIIIHLLQNTPCVITQYNAHITKGVHLIIPPYVDYEILRGLRYSNAIAKERMYQKLCASCEVGEMTRNVWLRAVDIYTNLRRKGFTVGDADTLIAAFCIEGNHTLVTNNIKDFMNVDGLALIDWIE
ncbi:MAG: PIN domain-containing protein [Oscillospiraceae bacterium]|jgi:tRNA(fMet)-specific endonuclease VapC|nr:PIN domain-containing protein [Oscillospiraceae bacterium]